MNREALGEVTNPVWPPPCVLDRCAVLDIEWLDDLHLKKVAQQIDAGLHVSWFS